MKLSNETLQLLKNFASINTNIVFKEGDVVSTISNAKNISRLQGLQSRPIDEKIFSYSVLDFGQYFEIENADIRIEPIEIVMDEFGCGEASLAREFAYIGDSPNDAPMFRAFELSVGVASVADYGDLLEHAPRYVTESDGGAGFAEVVAHLTRGVTR